MSQTDFASAYSKESFLRDGHALIDLLANYLEDVHAQRSAGHETVIPTFPSISPDQMLKEWPGEFPEEAQSPEAFHQMASQVLAQSIHLHDPHFMGHQVSTPLPVAAACEFLSAFLNNGAAVYEMGAVETIMEVRLVEWMSRLLGWNPKQSSGFLTSGGSLGNLTALLAARRAMGASKDGTRYAVLVSEQAHYCVKRSIQILGWGEDGAILIPTDERFRLRPELLEEGLRTAEQRGRKVVAVVGSACSTATGSFDPLDAIADFCEAHKLWFHVDGAHGASVALSDKYRHLLKGIERADSVVSDPHKMLMMPALLTMILFRDGSHSYGTYSQEASYLFQKAPQEEWYNLGHRTLECTKNLMALKLYVSLQLYGTRFFADYVTSRLDQARRFAGILRETGDFEVATEPQANIVCYRYAPRGVDEALAGDALQIAIRNEILASGRFYIVQARLGEKLYLRSTLLNPRTTDEHLRALVEAVREIGSSLGQRCRGKSPFRKCECEE